MENKLILAAVLDGYSRRKDGSCSIRFNTSELTTAQISDVDKLYNRFGILYFCDKEKLNQDDIKIIDDIDVDIYDTVKTPSQRLRNVLYVYFKEINNGELNMDEFKELYKKEIDKIINHYKNKLT